MTDNAKEDNDFILIEGLTAMSNPNDIEDAVPFIDEIYKTREGDIDLDAFLDGPETDVMPRFRNKGQFLALVKQIVFEYLRDGLNLDVSTSKSSLDISILLKDPGDEEEFETICENSVTVEASVSMGDIEVEVGFS